MSQSKYKVLVIKIGGLGDVLMTTPAVRSFKKSFPHSIVYLAVGKSNIPVLKNNPYVDHIIGVDDRHLLSGNTYEKSTEAWRLQRIFRRLGPDEIFVLHRDWRYNFLAYLSGCKNRFGFRRDLNGSFLTKSVNNNRSQHEIEKYLSVFSLKEGFAQDGTAMELFPSAADVTRTESFFRELSTHQLWVAIAPGGASNIKMEMAIKRWPLECYKELVNLLLSAGFSILLIGGASDCRFTKKISNNFIGKQVIDCAGILSIQCTYLALKRCSILITHDSGPMHIGACVGLPIISVFGPTNPKEYAPLDIDNCFCFWGGQTLSCSPCYKHGSFPKCYHKKCMYKTTPEMVFSKAKEILEKVNNKNFLQKSCRDY